MSQATAVIGRISAGKLPFQGMDPKLDMASWIVLLHDYGVSLIWREMTHVTAGLNSHQLICIQYTWEIQTMQLATHLHKIGVFLVL